MHVGSNAEEQCDHDGDKDVGSTSTGGYTRAKLATLQKADADIGEGHGMDDGISTSTIEGAGDS